MIAYASSLDQGGPMARSAEDCAYLMNVMAGHDAKDSTSVEKEVDDYVANLNGTAVKVYALVFQSNTSMSWFRRRRKSTR
jgi:aspartyl-tRNA(Asn)/glutamyl-tRNA(Gln) amidotransferase subunit A